MVKAMGLFGSKHKEGVDGNKDKDLAKPKIPRTAVVSFVYKVASSLLEDEDGEQAEEFYIEGRKNYVSSAGEPKWTFKEIRSNLRPVGEVELDCPRLHRDSPILLLQYTPTNKTLRS